jgi:hypothetical protein
LKNSVMDDGAASADFEDAFFAEADFFPDLGVET